MKTVTCDYCGNVVPLLTGADVYPHRPDLRNKPIWACMTCGAWVGCHPGTTNRLGRLANAESRRLKMDAHAAFDPIWKGGEMKRKAAYAWLRDQLGITDRECHMGWMNDDLLRRVVEVCRGGQP